MEETILTKEEAIKNHRLMWNWISEEILKRKKRVIKKEAFEHFGWNPVDSLCWCCEYDSEMYSIEHGSEKNIDYYDRGCDYCPLIWTGSRSCIPLYAQFLGAISRRQNDYLRASEIAKQIAELPERK